MKRKLLLGLGVVVALLVVIVVAGFVLINPQKLVAEKKDDVLKQVSAKIGRQVTAGDVTAHVGGALTARIANVQIAGADASKKPQLEMGALDMRFSLLHALLTFGKDLYVERFDVQGLTVRAARDAEGSWDFQDILDHLSSGDDAAAEKSEGAPAFLKGLRIASARIEDGRVELDDKMLGRPLAVGALAVTTSDVELGKPLSVKLACTLEDGARKSPVAVSASLAVLPGDLSFNPLPDVSVKANLTDVDLGPWGGLAPADAPAPVAGSLRAALDIAAKDDAKKLVVDGTLYARGLVLRDAVSAAASAADKASAPRGTALDADVNIALDVDQQAPRYSIKRLTLKGNGLDLNATLDAKGASLAALDKADVQASAQDLGRVLGVLPPSLRGLPEAVRIEGPLKAKLKSDGADIDASLDLDGARVRYMDVPDDGPASLATDALFDKPASKALNVTLHGTRGGKSLDVDRFALVVDKAKIGGTLSLPTDKSAPLVADINSGPVDLASLQDLVPPFKAAIGRGQRVAGTAEVKVKASSQGGKQQADAAVELKSLDVNLASTMVRGGGSVTLKAVPGADGVAITAGANLDALSVQKHGDGGALVVNKPSGLPLRLDVEAKKGTNRADVQKVLLAIGKSTIQGHGSVSALDKDTPVLDVDLGDVSLGFDDLRAAVPGASKLPAGGRLTGKLKLGGGTSAKTLVVDAKNISATFGHSRIAGDVRVKDLSAPVLEVKLPTLDVAFDDVRPLSASAADLPAGGRFSGSLTMSGDTARSSSVKAHVKIDTLVAAGSDMRGDVDIQDLDKPRFDLTVTSSNLDVDKLRDSFGGSDDGKPTKRSAKDKNKHGLSRETRAMLRDVNGKGSVTARHAVVKGFPLENFKGALVMTRGVVRFDALDFGLYDGKVSAAGSTVDLPAERLGYDLKLKGDNIDFGSAVASQTGLGHVFSGRLSPDVAVTGRGIAAGDFALSAEGPAGLTFKSLSLSSLDLLSAITDAVKRTGKVPGMKAASASDKGVELQSFKAATQFLGGRLKLQRPVETESGLGKITWTGAAGLDAGLDLGATVNLTPQTIRKMTGGKLTPRSAVPVPLKIGGTWDHPRVTGVDVGKLVGALLGSVAGGVVDDIKDDAKKSGTQAAKDLAGDALKAATGDKKKKKSTTDKAVDAAKKLFGH